MDPEDIRLTIVLCMSWGGFLSGFLVVVAYFPRRTVFPANVVFHHFVVVLLSLLAYLLRIVNLYKRDDTNDVECRIQAMGINYFTAAACIMTMCHLWNIHSFVVLRRSAEVLQKRFKVYLWLTYGTPFIPTVIMGIFAKVELLGLWCWTSRLGPHQSLYRGLLLYSLLIPSGVGGLYFCVRIVNALLQHSGKQHATVRGGTVIRLAVIGMGFVVSVLLASFNRLYRIWAPLDSDDRSEYSVGASELGVSIVSFFWGVVFLTSPTVMRFYSECCVSKSEELKQREQWHKEQRAMDASRRSRMYKSSSAADKLGGRDGVLGLDEHGRLQGTATTVVSSGSATGSALTVPGGSTEHSTDNNETTGTHSEVHDVQIRLPPPLPGDESGGDTQHVVDADADENDDSTFMGRDREDTEYDLLEKYEAALNQAFESKTLFSHSRAASTGAVGLVSARGHKRSGSHDDAATMDSTSARQQQQQQQQQQHEQRHLSGHKRSRSEEDAYQARGGSADEHSLLPSLQQQGARTQQFTHAKQEQQEQKQEEQEDQLRPTAQRGASLFDDDS